MPETPLEYARSRLQIWKTGIALDGDAYMKEQKKVCGQGILIAGKDETGKDAFLAIIGDREEEKVNALVDEAHRDPLAFEAASELAADDLRKTGRIPELSLRNFAAEVLAGKIKKPTRKGPSKCSNIERDKGFAHIAYHLQKKFDCHLYRNQTSPPNLQRCACDIIAEAARLEGIVPGLEVTYEMVKAAWKTWRHLYPNPCNK